MRLKMDDRTMNTYLVIPYKRRFKLICDSYVGFELEWTRLFNGLVCSIYEQKEYNRRAMSGDIGVRVQSSGIPGSPTESKAICLREIEEAVEACEFTEGLLNDVDDSEEIRRAVRSLALMKHDFETLEGQIDRMDEDDRRIFLSVLNGRCSYEELAEEYSVEPGSIVKRVSRIRMSLLKEMERKDYGKYEKEA